MSRDEFDTELTADRAEAAAIVRDVAEGVLAGAVRSILHRPVTRR